MFYIYFLYRGDKNITYIGYTDNLERRLKEYKNKKPELIYYEAYRDKRDALDRERKLKQRGQSVRRLKDRLKYSIGKT